MDMFEITHVGYFENIQEKIYNYQGLEVWGTSPDSPATQVRKINNDFWLSCVEYGAICIKCNHLEISTFPNKRVSSSKFNYFFSQEWLPAAYQICGTQVLHASAVANPNTGKIIAFCGDTGSGKSTFGFGFAQREKWKQIADDRLAFRVENSKVNPVYIPNNIHLRPNSANHFGQEPYSYELCSWIDTHLEIDSVFFLQPIKDHKPKTTLSFEIQPINKADSLKLLLKQAFAMTTQLPKQNQILIRNYLAFANQINPYQLSYTYGFEKLGEIFDAIEEKFI